MKVGLGSSTMADEPPSTSLPSAPVAPSFSTCSCCLSPSPFDAKERRKKRRDFGERQQVVKWDTRNILESTARSWIAGNFFFHLGDINPDSDLLPSQRRKLHPRGKEEESEPTRGRVVFLSALTKLSHRRTFEIVRRILPTSPRSTHRPRGVNLRPT